MSEEKRITIRLSDALLPSEVNNMSEYIRETLRMRIQGELCLTDPSLAACPHAQTIERSAIKKAVDTFLALTRILHDNLGDRNAKIVELQDRIKTLEQRLDDMGQKKEN